MNNKKSFQPPLSTFKKKSSQDSKNQQSALIVLSDSSEIIMNENVDMIEEV